MPLLGQIPLYEPIRIGGDAGAPIVTAEPDSPAARAFAQVAERAAAQVSIASFGTAAAPASAPAAAPAG